MHRRAVHGAGELKRNSKYGWRPNAPVDGPGKWVQVDEFRGTKSFGYFNCESCKKSWTSAHAFPKYTQGCKGCKTDSFPTFLWVNLTKDKRDQPAIPSDGKPHEYLLCEACKVGVCLKIL